MTELQVRIEAVRRAWRTAEALKGIAAVAADAIVIILALIAADTLYHLPAWLRGALLGVGVAALAGAVSLALVRPLRRRVSDDGVALYVEGRFPQLQGTLAAAVEYERKHPDSRLQAELVDALVIDCLEQTARIDLARAIGHRRLARRGIVAGFLMAFLLGGTAVRPGFFLHELARVLTPWRQLPLTAQEQAAFERRKQEEEERQRLLEALQAKEAALIEIKVTPGDTDVLRGESLVVRAAPTRVAGPLALRFRTSDGEWRSLAMPEDPTQPEKFAQVLRDITEDLAYQVVMGRTESPVFKIRAFDPATLKSFLLTYRFPKYTLLPDKTVTGMDANIEAIEGTLVDVALEVTSPLREGAIHLDTGRVIAMTVKGNKATGTIPVEKNGDYAIRAADAKGLPVNLPMRYSIKAIKDEPPQIEVVYPGIDSLAHPMEEAVFAARAEDAIGLKEVRLHAYYNLGKEEVMRSPCTGGGAALTGHLAEFVMDLAARPGVQPADMILFHFEAEDTKGQVAASDVYTAAVRKWETWMAYQGPGHAGAPHGYGGPELINVIGAAWNLHTRRDAMPKEQFNRESEKIGRTLESQ
jgi:hypothetical protein